MSPQQRHHQRDSVVPSPAGLNIDITQLLDHQHQQYMTSAASRHTPTHTGMFHHYVLFQSQCKHPDALLVTFVKHLHFED
jgi:hypothetical protein